MAETRCFFIGHREAPEDLYPALAEAVRSLIETQGVRAFYIGHYGAFDRMAARAVQEAKRAHPEVSLQLLLPYHPGAQPAALMPGFDGSFYPEGMERVPRRLAIVRANRYMAAHMDFLIAYVRHPGSNARELLLYAEGLERRGQLRIVRV